MAQNGSDSGVSLFDIAPAVSTVNINGVDVKVMGIGTRGVVELLQRFPLLASLMSGKPDVELAYKMAPEAITAIIAAGMGHLGDKKVEAAADGLAFGPQMALLSAIVKLTMPMGFGPFVEQFGAMVGVQGENQSLPQAPSPSVSSS